jgi:hypothetical protein
MQTDINSYDIITRNDIIRAAKGITNATMAIQETMISIVTVGTMVSKVTVVTM